MTSETGKPKTAPLHTVPAKETVWEIVRDQGKQLELLKAYLGIESEEFSQLETSQVPSGYPPYIVFWAPGGKGEMARRLPLPNRSVASDVLLRRLLERESVVSEYGVESPSEGIGREINSLRGAAEALLRDYGDLLARINRHTDLCEASRRLRETARANRETPLYWALVDLDDCIRACRPEDMSQEMAETLPRCVSQLAVGMSEEQMLGITDALYGAGFRPWKPPKRKARRGKKTAAR